MAEKRPRLGRDDWTKAALAALTEGGVAAVAIEPLAARLGATKGSAYWHFSNREDLLRATLERWERDQTEHIIEVVEVEPDALSRLHALFTSIFSHPKTNTVDLALLSASTHPTVREVLDRVTERRINYLTQLFIQLGFPPDTAQRRAVLAYSTYLGNTQLRHTTPTSLPKSPLEWRVFVDDALRTLTSE